jgi:hypothetical protein
LFFDFWKVFQQLEWVKIIVVEGENNCRLTGANPPKFFLDSQGKKWLQKNQDKLE